MELSMGGFTRKQSGATPGQRTSSPVETSCPGKRTLTEQLSGGYTVLPQQGGMASPTASVRAPLPLDHAPVSAAPAAHIQLAPNAPELRLDKRKEAQQLRAMIA